MANSSKEYYGSASQYQKGAYKNVEGKRTLLSWASDHFARHPTEMEQDLQCYFLMQVDARLLTSNTLIMLS